MSRPDGLPEQLQGPRPGRRPRPRQPAASPSTHMTLMRNIHYTLSTTHYHAPTCTWVIHGTDSHLPAHYPPPPRTTRAPTRTPGRTSRRTPTSGARGSAGPWRCCSPSAASTRTLARRCMALRNGPNGPGRSPGSSECGRSHCAPSRERPPRNRLGLSPPPPTTLQLCAYMLAACLMALLGPGPDTPPKTTPT